MSFLSVRKVVEHRRSCHQSRHLGQFGGDGGQRYTAKSCEAKLRDVGDSCSVLAVY